MKFLCILPLFTVLSSCATKQNTLLEAPNYLRGQEILNAKSLKSIKTSGDSEKLLIQYLFAKDDHEKGRSKKSCNSFGKLSSNERFSLKDVALVYTLKDCNYKLNRLNKIWDETNIPSYLAESYYEVSLNLAKNFKQQNKIAEFSYELSKLKPLKSERQNLIEDAVNIAVKLDPVHPRIEEFKNQLYKISPKSKVQFNAEILPEEYFSIGKDFEQSRDFTKAREFYEKIINEDQFEFDEKVKAYNALRISYKVARDLKTFLNKTNEMQAYLEGALKADPKNSKIQEAWVDTQVNLARATWTEHDNPGARKILDKVIKRKIGTPDQLANLYWVYAQMHLERKENKEALKKLTTASQFKIKNTEIKENVFWGIIWNKYQLKNFQELEKDALKFIDDSNDNYFKNKISFWLARSYELTNNLENAQKLYNEIYERDPLSYYGLISAMQIQKPLNPIPSSVISTNSSGDATLDWLIATGEEVLSQNYLKEINSSFKTKSQRHEAMSLYAKTKWYKGAFSQLFNFPVKERNLISIQYISVLYPTPYKDIFERFSKEASIPLELALSITRQESTFDTYARSWADAFGLMQLIPEKAYDLNKKYNLGYATFSDLYRPDLNVQMGTILLRELYSRFDGKFAQNVAGYNASSKAIRIWEKERFNGDYLEFIESIPYKETRKYIKLVFRNFYTYKRQFAKEDIVIPKDFFAKEFN